MGSHIVWKIVAWAVPALVVVLVVIALLNFSVTALPQPGHLETEVSELAKQFIISRASRRRFPPRPQDKSASLDDGSTKYGLDCALCHGNDGRAQEPPGQWMYPRAADLTSRRVQGYSDQELFWIIQNGIRFTGMPAFGKVETPDHIWDLVNYVRTLPGDLRSENSLHK